MFWECEKVQPLWKDLIAFCKRYVDPNADYCRNNCILFGFALPVLNLIVTACKFVIHTARLFNKQIAFKDVLRKIRHVKNVELLAAKMLPQLHISKTVKYWKPLLDDKIFAILDKP